MLKRIILNITGILSLIFLSYSCGSDENDTVFEQEQLNTYNGETIILLTQQEVNDFGANGYITVNANLGIGGLNDFEIGPTNNSIIDLSPLNTIKTINNGGIVIKGNNSLINLNALNNLESSTGIQIINNDVLTNIDGLNNLQNVDVILVRDNEVLENINGFTNINTSIFGLSIYDNPTLSNIEGLSNINSINGTGNYAENLLITNNDNLENLNGLSNLTFFNDNAFFNIKDNDNLSDFCGIQNLLTSNGLITSFNVENNAYNPTQEDIIAGSCYFNEGNGAILLTQQDVVDFGNLGYTHITEGLIIGDLANQQSNTNITSLNPLNNLISIDGQFIIYGNLALVNLEGLNNLNNVTGNNPNPYITGDLIIANNSLTDFCALQTLMEIDADVEFGVQGNPYNPTKQDIIDGNCSQ